MKVERCHLCGRRRYGYALKLWWLGKTARFCPRVDGAQLLRMDSELMSYPMIINDGERIKRGYARKHNIKTRPWWTRRRQDG